MTPEITKQLLDSFPIVGGVVVVEGQYDDTTLIEDVPPSSFLDHERKLFETTHELTPKLPFEEFDLVVLDRQGKEISGQGTDTNVVGHWPFPINEPAPEKPSIERTYTHGSTEKTHDNAMGVRSADVIHEDIVAESDAQTTLINAPTASTIRGVKLPPVIETDRVGMVVALSIVGIVEPGTIWVVHATNTIRLHRLYTSPALVGEAREQDDLCVVEDPTLIVFEDGQFTAPPLRD